MKFLFIYLLIINAVTFFHYWNDKSLARKKYAWRTPEKSLLFYALVGGTPAAFYACHLFRHKTKKSSFRNKLYMVLILQIIVTTLLILK
jgi:uncharacterized membrane protein YsdA (DUF1294 family)